MFYFLIALWCICSVMGDYLSKRWVARPSLLLLILTFLFYGGSTSFWLPALKMRNQIAIMGTMVMLLGALSTLFVGTCAFGETLRPIQWLGILLALVAIVILNS